MQGGDDVMRKLLSLVFLAAGLFAPAVPLTQAHPLAQASREDQSQTVYVTRTGSKYHRDGCTYLKSRIPISLRSAKARGYTPCSRCNPPE